MCELCILGRVGVGFSMGFESMVFCVKSRPWRSWVCGVRAMKCMGNKLQGGGCGFHKSNEIGGLKVVHGWVVFLKKLAKLQITSFKFGQSSIQSSMF
jgi:hypothetical protein